jgi:flagellar hook protein FlgE
MLRSLYSGVSGMRGFQNKLDVIGNNIANVNTVGFKMGRVMFKDILSQTVGGITAPDDTTGQGGVNAKQIGLGVAVGAIDTVFTPGSAQTTNVTTDLRIDGDGFFLVKATEDQVPYLTRAGNFTIDANRDLVTSDGLHVVGMDGAFIKIPADVTAFTIAQNGKIIGIDQTGTSTDTQLQIGVMKVANPGGLEKIGGNLYRSNSNSDLTTPEIVEPNNTTAGTGAIISGQLEMSNVDLTSEFTEMIIAQRGFQSNSRIITTSDEILQEIVNLKH